MKKPTLIICGAHGRMGQEILSIAKSSKKFHTIVEVDHRGRAQARKLKEITPKRPMVVIDFSLPAGLIETAKWCAQHDIPLVTGVTGLSKKQMQALATASHHAPVLWAPNMSLGMNVFACAIEYLAKRLSEADWQLEEFHHRKKVDSPSGTAKWLQKIAEKNLGRKLPAALAGRGGGIVGEHKFWIMAAEEVITIQHSAISRAVFARGAVHAALWIKTKRKGMYSMKDVVNG